VFDLNISQFQVAKMEGSCPGITFSEMVSRFKVLYRFIHACKPVVEALCNRLCSEFVLSVWKVQGT
jgi:hypothetical protein